MQTISKSGGESFRYVIYDRESNYEVLKIQPPYGGLLSRSCGGFPQKGPSGQMVILPDERSDGRTTRVRWATEHLNEN